jgi:ankyrin repeat protein
MFKNIITVKITNEKENHHGFQYQTGLNILKETFQKEGSCVPGGFYFTTLDHVHNFYHYGVHLRIVEIPDDAQVVKDPDETMGLKWRTDRIILGGKYPLCDVETIKKFDLKITREYIIQLDKYGKIDVLISLQEKYKNLIASFASEALTIASCNGHVNVLEWWLKSGLKLKYTEHALILASKYGHVNVLDWWFKSGLPLKYDQHALHWASRNGHVNVLEWWKNSGLPLKYSNYALD